MLGLTNAQKKVVPVLNKCSSPAEVDSGAALRIDNARGSLLLLKLHAVTFLIPTHAKSGMFP
eukprot:5367332-Pyramimonas_sp.AAC.1